MRGSELKRSVPGYIATALVILATSLLTLWGVGEMFYEGWWGAWSERLLYVMLAAASLLLTLVAITWPRAGGWLLIGIGGAWTAWWWGRAARVGWLTLSWLLGAFPISGLFVVIGVLFLFEGRYRRRLRAEGWKPPKRWLRRSLRYVLAIGFPLLVTAALSVYWLPILLTRMDDGDRGARLIEGNGVTLVWAPAGPGWWEGIGPSKAAGRLLPGANLSWNDIAFYGVPPVGFGEKAGYEDRDATAADMEATGLCRYLSEDGLTLMTEPQDIWRMPTTDEIVRSLVRDGENAGCTWDGESESANCRITPDKETPLWVPSWSPIYYLSGDEFDEHEAWYVPYTGGHWSGGLISGQRKSWGNPRHGYRCVREPQVGTEIAMVQSTKKGRNSWPEVLRGDMAP